MSLDLPSATEPQQRRLRSLQISQLDDEGWSKLNSRALGLMIELREKIELASKGSNTELLHRYLRSVVRGALVDQYSRPKEEDGGGDERSDGPFERFRRQHTKHTLPPRLRFARESGDLFTFRRMARTISGDGWRDFLN